MPQLPVDPDLLPESIAAVAFAEQARVAMPRELPDFQALAMSWPVRNRGKSECVPMPAGQSAEALVAFGHAMHGIMQVGQELRRSSSSSSLGRTRSLLPLEDMKGQEEEPVIDMLPARQKEEEKVTEEVKVALEKALPKRRKKENAAADAESVAETLARLRDGCRKKDKDEKKSKDGERKSAVKAMKKPAAAGLGRAAGLRDQARDLEDLSAGQSHEIDVASPPPASEGRRKKAAQRKTTVEQASQGCAPSAVVAGTSAGRADAQARKKAQKEKKKATSEGSAPSAVSAGTSAGRLDEKPSKGRKKSMKEKTKAPKSKKATRASKKASGTRGTAEAREAKRQRVLALVAGAEAEVSARLAVGETVALFWTVSECVFPAWSCAMPG